VPASFFTAATIVDYRQQKQLSVNVMTTSHLKIGSEPTLEAGVC
jgi:hypothetical protein